MIKPNSVEINIILYSSIIAFGGSLFSFDIGVQPLVR